MKSFFIAVAMLFAASVVNAEPAKPAYCSGSASILKSVIDKAGDYNIDDGTHQREYIALCEKATAKLPVAQQKAVYDAVTSKKVRFQNPFKDEIMKYLDVFTTLHNACLPCGGGYPCYAPVTIIEKVKP